ncbi:MAG: DUF1858 domain-containing protein [Patescibacteria group bacterium]
MKIQRKKKKGTVPGTSRNKATVQKDILIGELLHKYPEAASVLMRHGFHCIGCAVSPYESLEAGAAVHGIPLEPLMKELNAVLAERNGPSGTSYPR